MTPDLDDGDVRAALQLLAREPLGEDTAFEHTSSRATRIRARRRRTASAAIALVALAALTAAVGAARHRGRAAPAHQPITTQTTTATSVSEAPVHVDAWPPEVRPGESVRVVLVNGSDSPVDVCERDLRVYTSDASSGPSTHAPACQVEEVLPGSFSHEWSRAMPAVPGRYRLVLGDASTVVTVSGHGGGAPEPTDPGSSTSVDLMGASTLRDLHTVVPSEMVVLGGSRLALAWSTPCDEPGAALRLGYDAITPTHRDTDLHVELTVGRFTLQPPARCSPGASHWSTIIDLPRPLHGRAVVVDGSPLTARAVAVWPLGERLPAAAEPHRLALAVLDARVASGWVSLAPFQGCGHWFQNPMLVGHELFVQAFVPAPGERCADHLTPKLGFTYGDRDAQTVFGGAP
jgi:hypothetical protein